jgi:hypothetical protein
MILDPAVVLRSLATGDALRLDALPREHGIYALRDHGGAIRYIGITKADTRTTAVISSPKATSVRSPMG